MDGTWLTDQKDYDKELFLREFAEMQKQGIKFVVASGNQYANLMTRFPEVLDKIYFVAENGALVAQGRQILHVDSLSAYVKKSSGRAYKQEMKKYMEHITVVDSFGEIDDQIFKVSLTVPEDKMSKILRELKEKYPEVGFVSGAADSIDMQTKGMNKAVGLAYLSQKLGIKSSEMIAFGDSGNDVGMLKYVGRSFATATALPEAKQAAGQIIGSSNESAVQKEIAKLLEIK